MSRSRIRRGHFRVSMGKSSPVWLALGLGLLLGAPPARSRKPRWTSHFYYVNDPTSRQSLEANSARVHLVSPQWYAADQEGRVISSVDNDLVEWASRSRIPLIPLLVNDKFQPAVAHAVLNDEQAQSLLVDQIVEMSRSNHFFGIQLDFENVPGGDREAYSHFVARMAKEVHKHRMKLWIAVPAPLEPSPPPTVPGGSPWKPSAQAAAFDYQALAKVADSITLMTYDEHVSPGEPGPIAGLPWVEECLRETLNAIPRKKFLLGVPLYYRHWTGKSVAEGPYEEALNLATHWKAKVEMDAEQREKKFQFDDGHDSHVVWLEDAETLKERVALVQKYGLAGFSAWRLGQEDPASWEAAFSQTK